jgi:hypothetical protein
MDAGAEAALAEEADPVPAPAFRPALPWRICPSVVGRSMAGPPLAADRDLEPVLVVAPVPELGALADRRG